MKDHKIIEVNIYIEGNSVEGAIKYLRETSEGIVDPYIEMSRWDGLVIRGWKPLTEEEKETAKKRRAGARKAAARRKEKERDKEKAKLEKLAKKYNMKITPEENTNE